MKGIFLTVAVALTLLGGGAVFANAVPAHAEECPPDTTCEPADPSAEADTSSDTAGPPKNPTAQQLGQGDSENWVVWALTPVMTIFAWLLGIAALTLDASVHYTVVHMGDIINPNQYAAVGVTWRVLRDIGNIILIFGFLAIGISIIIGNEIIGYGQKMLPRLLIAAVALNFSLFAAEAVIDVGNLFATQFYTQINGRELPNNTEFKLSDLGNNGIAQKVLGVFGFQSFYGDSAKNAKLFTNDKQLLLTVLGITVFITTTFIFFSLAFILIARFIYLIFLMITSPIGVAGYAMPKLESLAKQWWEQLFRQTMTAPVLLLGLYIALMVITDDMFLKTFGVDGGGAWTKFANGNYESWAGIILSFMVAMGLLLGVMVISKKMGAFGADAAMKWGSRASFGAVSFAGRATLGNVGNVLASKRVQSIARRNSVLGYTARLSALAGKGLRSSTYDIRNLPGVVAVPGGYGVDVGKGASYTAKQAWDQVDGRYGTKGVRKWFEESTAEREQAGREIDFKNAQATIRNNQNMRDQGIITDDQMRTLNADADKKIKESLAKMSTEQLAEMKGIKDGIDELVKNLSPQQFESLLKSDKLNETQKSNLKRTRYLDFEKAVTASAPDPKLIRKLLGSFSKGELEAMPSELLANDKVLEELSDKQRETIADSKERTAAEKDMVRNSSRTGKIEATFKEEKEKHMKAGVSENAAAELAAVAAAAHADFKKLTVAQVAKLDKEMLKQRAVAEQLSAASLIELQEQKKLTQEEMKIIGEHIVNNTGSTANPKAQDYINSGPGKALWG